MGTLVRAPSCNRRSRISGGVCDSSGYAKGPPTSTHSVPYIYLWVGGTKKCFFGRRPLFLRRSNQLPVVELNVVSDKHITRDSRRTSLILIVRDNHPVALVDGIGGDKSAIVKIPFERSFRDSGEFANRDIVTQRLRLCGEHVADTSLRIRNLGDEGTISNRGRVDNSWEHCKSAVDVLEGISVCKAVHKY